ncbi:MAG: hypothetical protein JNL64_16100 [Blastocatellia bacterium]|nr:hypothetical protein [Blastocatellia bacterium]
MEDREKVLRGIADGVRDAFSSASPIVEHEISPVACEHGDNLRGALGGRRWQEIEPEWIASLYDHLPFLSDVAYHSYYPAFVLAAIRDFQPPGDSFMFLVFDSSPSERSMADFSSRKRLFSLVEKRAVHAFFEYANSLEEMAPMQPELGQAVANWDITS